SSVLFILHLLSSDDLFPIIIIFFYSSLAFLDIHSFPTRRSSDLYYKNPPRNSGGFFIGKMAEILMPAGRKMKKISKKVLTMHLQDRKSTRLNSSHVSISYAVFCLKKKKRQ